VSSFELSSGVVVDPDRGEIYVMSPAGGIVALDLGSGAAVWRSRDAAKPLTVSGDVLIGQAEPTGPGGDLAIVGLDTRRQGAPVTRTSVDLPPGVQAAIQQAANRSFTTHAQGLGTEATVSWEFVERPLQGFATGALEVLPDELSPPGVSGAETLVTEPGGALVVARGAVRLGLVDGTVTPIEPPPEESFTEPTPISPSAAASDLTAQEELPDLPGPQFLSADGSHVLISERIGDESVREKWFWRIFERSNGRPVGAVRSHVRFAPFFVRGFQIVHLVETHAYWDGDALVDEPVQIRAADLRTGEADWSQPVRDITDREAPPP
jgi:hypothetical protein